MLLGPNRPSQAMDEPELIFHNEALPKYEALTGKKSEHSTRIQQYIAATRFFDETNFIKCIGHDHEGTITYLVFGYRFPAKDGQLRDRFKRDIDAMFSFIIERGRQWQIVYFHSLVGSFDVGTLSALKATLF